MAQTLHFTIEGQFVTDLVRTWFWDEDRPYETCREVLFNCLISDQIDDEFREQAVQDILEGRKKLVGVNEFQLVDDGENIRRLSKKVEEMREKAGVLEILNDMNIHALTYVDPYSTYRSTKAAFDFPRIKTDTYDDCLKFFAGDSVYGSSDDLDDRFYNEATEMGLWLFNEPETVYKATSKGTYSVGSLEFWENIYQLTKDRESPSFQERNTRYFADLRMRNREEPRTLEETIQQGKQELENIVQTTERDSVENFSARVALSGAERDSGRDQILYVTSPDDMLNWEALISPKGDWYSVTFGGHNTKAYHIIATHPEWFGFKTKKDLINIHIDKALDTLIDAGWCATRCEMIDACYYLTVPTTKNVTKAQKDVIWEAMVKFEVRPSNIYLLDE